MSKTRRIGRIIGNDSISHFKTPQSHGNDSEARKLATVRVEAEGCFFAYEQLLQRQNRKGFLHRIVTGDEKWVHCDNSKRKISWGSQFMRLRLALKEKRPQYQKRLDKVILQHDNARPHVENRSRHT